jgi:signal transduction histidine kinase
LREKVLIVSGDPEFDAALLRSWRVAGSVPEYQVVEPDASCEWPVSCVAVLDGAKLHSRLPVDIPMVITVTDGELIPVIVEAGRRIVQLRRDAGWAEIAAVLAWECVLREQALQRGDKLEERLSRTERFSALGKFIAGHQHDMANALTGLMGHAELLMTERDISQDFRHKMGTIHAMSLRIHDVLQDLSSLDRELRVAERQATQKRLDETSARAAVR